MPQCAKKLDSCPKWIMWMLSNLKGCVIFHVVFNSDSRGMSRVRLCMSVLPIHDWSVGNAQLQLGHCDQSSLDELPAKTDSYAENCMSRDVGLHRAQLSKHQLIKSDDQQMWSIPIWSRPMTWTLKIPSLAKRLYAALISSGLAPWSWATTKSNSLQVLHRFPKGRSLKQSRKESNKNWSTRFSCLKSLDTRTVWSLRVLPFCKPKMEYKFSTSSFASLAKWRPGCKWRFCCPGFGGAGKHLHRLSRRVTRPRRRGRSLGELRTLQIAWTQRLWRLWFSSFSAPSNCLLIVFTDIHWNSWVPCTVLPATILPVQSVLKKQSQQVPQTLQNTSFPKVQSYWAETKTVFIILAAGVAPVSSSLGENWTLQLHGFKGLKM